MSEDMGGESVTKGVNLITDISRKATKDWQDYRTISLINHPSKLLPRVLLSRLKRKAEHKMNLLGSKSTSMLADHRTTPCVGKKIQTCMIVTYPTTSSYPKPFLRARLKEDKRKADRKNSSLTTPETSQHCKLLHMTKNRDQW